MIDHRRPAIDESISKVLATLNDRRIALGLIDLEEDRAPRRIRALSLLSTEQFMQLLRLADEPRLGQVRALEAAQRQQHHGDVGAVGQSSLDDRILYRWSCSCGDAAPGDYLVAEDARQGWRIHAGIQADVDTVAEERQCAWERCDTGPYGTRGTFVVRSRFPRQRYCCDRCRSAANDLDRPRPRLESTE